MPVTYADIRAIVEVIIRKNMLLLIRKKFTVRIRQPVKKIIFVHKTVIRIIVKNGILQVPVIRHLIRWIRHLIRQEAAVAADLRLADGIKKSGGIVPPLCFSGFAHGFH